MPAKKTTVKKADNSSADLRALSMEDLQKKLQTARTDLLDLQKSLAANELANPHAVTKVRKEIARIMTIMAEVSKSNSEEKEQK